MKTVREVSKLSGISVRTLHHYDAIGLLKPTATTGAGYRLYGEEALRRLQSILLLRELRFPLRDIRSLLADPDFDQQAALAQQVHMLELERDRLDRLISLAKNMMTTGGDPMDFKAFDKREQETYAAEARARWGRTTAWQESQEKAAAQSPEQQQDAAAGMMAIFAEFGAVKHLDAAAPEAQALAAKLQQHITDHYYTCTREILRGLGQMYTADERFSRNIDQAGGKGAAAFAARAIAAYTEPQ